jgi:hypothetical protein
MTGAPGGRNCDGLQELLTEDAPRSLRAYLSLPLEQYSVLDPKWIRRLPVGRDTGG